MQGIDPLPPPETITVYCCATFDTTGKIILAGSPGCDMGFGFYSDLKEAQKFQLLEKLKSNEIHVFALNIPI